MAEQKSSVLVAPLHGAASVLSRMPGAGTVGRAAQETLDRVGAVSPRGRRLAVYTGAGVLGVAGVVEWPVALTGAAVAWLTQPRPVRPAEDAEDVDAAPAEGPRGAREPARDLGSAALRAGGTGEHTSGAPAGAPETGGTKDSGAARNAGDAPDTGAPDTGAPDAGGHSPASGHAPASGTSRTSGAGGAGTPPGRDTAPGTTAGGPLGPTARPGRTTS